MEQNILGFQVQMRDVSLIKELESTGWLEQKQEEKAAISKYYILMRIRLCASVNMKSDLPICCRNRRATLSGKIFLLRIKQERSPPEHHSRIK